MKTAVKTPARKTNNQASFGSSLLQNNMEVEAVIELARHLDETGLHRVRTGFDQTWSGLVGSYQCITQTCQFWFAQNMYTVWTKFVRFVPSLHNVQQPSRGFSG